jgi:hypothetical protein
MRVTRSFINGFGLRTFYVEYRGDLFRVRKSRGFRDRDETGDGYSVIQFEGMIDPIHVHPDFKDGGVAKDPQVRRDVISLCWPAILSGGEE